MVYEDGLKDAGEGELQIHDLTPVHRVILIVEDENPIRILMAKTLEAKGYAVLEASNGTDALELCEEHRGPIHLLITDRSMPLMTGSELISRVAIFRPTMRIMCLSARERNADQPSTNVYFLPKPFTLKGLISKVRDILDDAPG